MTDSHFIDVYLEIGKKRIFAGAVDWPGWCRSGPDEPSALRSLFEYGPRYARVLLPARLGFEMPARAEQLQVVERLSGNTTTDFGAPDAAPASYARPVDESELERFQNLLRACWQALDEIASQAAGKTLRLGPRGGGRDVKGILRHVLGGDQGYLAKLGGKLKSDSQASLGEQLAQTRQAILDTLDAAAHGKIEERGPRGGLRWTPRYFVRRSAWHTLDHAWEIEDRALD